MTTEFTTANIKAVGIVGMGLIGGSYAKAYHAYSDAAVYGFNRSHSVI